MPNKNINFKPYKDPDEPSPDHFSEDTPNPSQENYNERYSAMDSGDGSDEEPLGTQSMPTEESVTKFLLDTREYQELLYHTLKGHQLNPISRKWVQILKDKTDREGNIILYTADVLDKEGNPIKGTKGTPVRVPDQLLNNRGVSAIMRHASVSCSKIMNCTNLEDKEITAMGILFANTLIDELTYKYNDYEIRSTPDCQGIYTMLVIPFKAVMKQSYKDGMRVFLAEMMRYNEDFENVDRDSLGTNSGRGNSKKGFRLF